MSKLLINEAPLTFQPSLAVAIGINEAIVLQQVHYWLVNPKNKGYEQDGYKWVYNTYAEWRENNFPFWSENTIQRIFSNLEDAGLIVSIQPMKGKYDRTKYYRIDYPKLDGIDDTKLVSSLNESETTQRQPLEKKGDLMDGILAYALPEIEKEKQAINAFESAFGIDPGRWDWYPDTPASKAATWKDFRAYLVARYAESTTCFAEYATFSRAQYAKGTMTAMGIRRNPELFPDSWLAFLAYKTMNPDQFRAQDKPALTKQDASGTPETY